MYNNKPIAIFENVTKIFNKKNWAIKKINLTINRGCAIAVIGPRNSGKSVLSRLIANLIKPTNGIVEYNFIKDDIYSSIGFQFEQTVWPDGFKVKEIVNLYIRIYDINDEKWLEQLAQIFDITSRWNRTLNSCSKTWLKLFSLYLAILHKPELLVLDEVSNMIGLDMKQKIIEFLKEYKKEHNATFIIVSPDGMLFEEICCKVLILQKGVIVKEESIKELLPKKNSYREYVIGIMKKLETEEIVIQPALVFKPILSKYKKYFEDLSAKYQKLTNDEKLSDLIDQRISLTMLKNYEYHTKLLYDKLWKLASTALEKKYINDVKIEIKKLLKTFKKANYLIKKEPIEFEYKETEEKIIEKILKFNKYIKKELYPIFKSNKILIGDDEITAKLSQRELLKLKALKKKYIQEEIKLMKFEQKLLKNKIIKEEN